jgi:hypothetical protein
MPDAVLQTLVAHELSHSEQWARAQETQAGRRGRRGRAERLRSGRTRASATADGTRGRTAAATAGAERRQPGRLRPPAGTVAVRQGGATPGLRGPRPEATLTVLLSTRKTTYRPRTPGALPPAPRARASPGSSRPWPC